MFTKKESGIAMVITLMLSFLALVLISIMLSIITNGTKMSGEGKQYATALDAAKGGENILISMLNYDIATPDLPANMYTITNQNCLQTKMDTPVTYWNCNSSPDISMILGKYNVNATIVSTQIILPTATQGETYTYYSVNIQSSSTTRKENANINFVYEIK